MSQTGLIFKMSCPDAIGLVAQVTSLIAGEGLNLAEVYTYSDVATKWFFARFRIESMEGRGDFVRLEEGLSHFAARVRADWSLRRIEKRQRLAVLVSKETHCLTELLWRRKFGELNADIPLVISNHTVCREHVEAEGIPFHHVPVDPANREDSFRRVASLCEEAQATTIVLARYMQILPPWFCEQFAGSLINIHHSFLPAFAGADPYRQAFERGVKLIGATCHYATEELDAGPIIDQEVVRVEHFHDLADLRRLGRDCERLALARGLRYHLEDRVLIHGAKTVVFRD